jgi:hypothetical protein
MLDAWNAAPHRYFAAYRRRDDRRLLGHSVIDEFHTLSSPIFFAPHSLLGKVYDAGISLGHRRDPAMAIDQGWPPLCIGLEEGLNEAAEPPADWDHVLQAVIEEPAGRADTAWREPAVRRADVGPHHIEWVPIGEAGLFVTSAPLLPKQLGRLCEAAASMVSVAVSTGNRIQRAVRGAPLSVTALSENRLQELVRAAREIAG